MQFVNWKVHFGDKHFLQNAPHLVVPDIIRGMMSGMCTCLPVRQAFGASKVPTLVLGAAKRRGLK